MKRESGKKLSLFFIKKTLDFNAGLRHVVVNINFGDFAMKFFFTSGINNEVAESAEFAKEVVNIIHQYCNREWGDLCRQDKKMNEDAIKHGGRIVAAYQTSEGKVYIITDDTKATEWITTVLFASEY